MPKSVLDFNVKGSGGEIEKYLPEQNAQRIQQNAKAIADIAGGGEVNTMSNEGTGIGLFWQKDVFNLELNNLKSENDRLSIALDGVSHDVEFTVNEGNIDHNALANYAANQHFLENAINLANINEKNHVSLANKNAEANIKHLTDAQLAALHAKYTNAEAVAAVLSDDAYLKLVGDIMGGAINMNSNNITGVNTIITLATPNYDKFRLWTNPAYCIGLMDAMTYGGLNNYAMTFTVYHTVDRGWVWRDDDDAKNDGAMSLTTGGILTVKESITLGTGAVITTLGDTTTLANSDVKVPTNTTVKEAIDLKATTAEAIAAVLADDKYLKNYENDAMNGVLTTIGLIINGDIAIHAGGTVDGVDIGAVLGQNVKTGASPTFVGLTLSGNLITTSTIDGVDLLAFKTDYDAKINQAVKTTSTPSFTGLISNGNIQINIGSTVDGVDISDLPALIDANTTVAEVNTLIATHTGDDNAHHEVFESLVEDLSPQLGGDLDLNAKDIKEGAAMLYDISQRKLFPDKIVLALGSTIDKFDSDVNLAGDNTDVPTSLAVKTYVDASIKTNEYYAPINAGLGGFIEQTGIGSSYFAPMNDVSAYAEASLFIKDGGSFKVSIVHVGDGGNNGKEASGLLFISYDVADATDAWDVNGVNLDLALGNANILKIQEYGNAFTVADNSKIGLTWGKDDAAGGAVGNIFVYGFILKRQ